MSNLIYSKQRKVSLIACKRPHLQRLHFTRASFSGLPYTFSHCLYLFVLFFYVNIHTVTRLLLLWLPPSL